MQALAYLGAHRLRRRSTFSNSRNPQLLRGEITECKTVTARLAGKLISATASVRKLLEGDGRPP